MKIKFLATWSPENQIGIPKGTLALEVKKDKIKNLGIFLNKLNEKQSKKEELKDLEISINAEYQKRTLDQNALMHSLYGILANEMNGNRTIGKDLIKPLQLYENDLFEMAPRIELKVPNENVNIVKTIYRLIEEESPSDTGFTYLKAIITSSHFNTVQMTQWIENIFDRLAMLGVSFENSSDIAEYWRQHREFIDKNNIQINSGKDIISDYKKANSSCEACGKYIAENGHLAHIKSIGSGGLNKSYNFLHLCQECHVTIQHQKGWTFFIEKFPHLEKKIEDALLNSALDSININLN